jgi:hypothetical protein
MKGSPDLIVASDSEAQAAALKQAGGKPVISISASSAGDEAAFEAGQQAGLSVARALAGVRN